MYEILGAPLVLDSECKKISEKRNGSKMRIRFEKVWALGKVSKPLVLEKSKNLDILLFGSRSGPGTNV